jgi:hypothetical protein
VAARRIFRAARSSGAGLSGALIDRRIFRKSGARSSVRKCDHARIIGL